MTKTNEVPKEIFRAYDIRGIVGKTLTADLVYKIGVVFANTARANNVNEIIIARDGRLSSPKLMVALTDGIRQVGVDVIDVGLVPTPLLYFATHVLSTKTGIMITGSHNPAEYNGLKIVLQGKALSALALQAVYDQVLHYQEPESKTPAKFKCIDIQDQYIQAITQNVNIKKSFKIVIDGGHGVAGIIAPKFFKQLGCKIVELYCEVDGHFPHHHPDPSVPENLNDLITTVKETKADLGFAFDGDADRLGVVTQSGNIIWPDLQMMLFADSILNQNPGADIIFDVKCTRHLPELIQKKGGNPIMWKTGHSLIKSKLRESQAPFAGEMSGHLFFNDRWYGFDDAFYTAARLLELLSDTDKDLEALYEALPKSVTTPEIKMGVMESQKFALVEQFKKHADFKEATLTDIDGLRVDFNNGWGLMRCSNTTPNIIFRFEADTKVSLKEIQNQFREVLLKLDNTLKLPF